MPRRRFHFTGRQRITSGDLTVTLRNEAVPLSFHIPHLSLQRYHLPSDALVRVEAYHQTNYSAFELGTVAEIRIPERFALPTFYVPDGIRFSVKVTAASGDEIGQLLAEGTGIRPEWADGGRESMLPVVPGDLGQEVFRLSLDGYPTLLVNSKLIQWKEVATTAYFRSLVFPGVLRQILTHILTEETLEGDESDDWRSRWLEFASVELSAGVPPELQEGIDDQELVNDWVADAVSAFCKKHQSVDSFIQSWTSEANQ